MTWRSASLRVFGWRTAIAVCSRSTQQRWPIGRGPLRQLANDTLRDVADSIEAPDHWLLANDHVIQEAFELCRLARVDQSLGLLPSATE